MSYSIQRELEEIEYRRTQAQQMSQKGPRRGSSIFAVPDDNDESGPYGRPSYLAPQPGEMLVDFPEESQLQQQSIGYSVQSQQSSSAASGHHYMNVAASTSSVQSDGFLHSAKMVAADSDAANATHYNSKPRRGEAARMQELANSQDLPGGANHRPLVGGFAAAAYEAAKAHHYSNKRNRGSSSIPRDRPPPPCI